MIRCMVISTDNSCKEVLISENIEDELQKLVGEWAEVIRDILPGRSELVMIVNRAGIIKGLPSNIIATYLYNNVVAGDVLFINEINNKGEKWLCGLTNNDIDILYNIRNIAIEATKKLINWG